MNHILAIDQGTTSSRAIAFDANMEIVAIAQQEFQQHYPNSGWVEHDPDDLLNSTLKTCHEVIAKLPNGVADIVAIGITNQRETTLVWDKRTGKPIYNAIVWQDRRTADYCEALKSKGLEETIIDHTGLLLDPYFSGTKLAWLLGNIDGAQTAAENGDLLFGTVDCYLIWHLSGGAVHATDATNAARTMLYDIRNGCWDADICAAMNIPLQMLPDVRDCAGKFGKTDQSLFGKSIPILGVAGDQQAATLGQACFNTGMMKSTYGTGCFALLNTGTEMVRSNNRLLTTIAYQLDGEPTYALEGSIFIAGAVVQWLRDGLGIIENAAETQSLAKQADPMQNVYMVPAFTGLGAPYWDAKCRGAIFGLTRNSGPAEFAKAALESVGYQTRDLLEAMAADMGGTLTSSALRVDGGMAASDWTMQFLSDITDIPVDRPKVLETTAMGVAWLAGMQAGFYPGQGEFASSWAAEKKYSPLMDSQTRKAKYRGWKDAVSRTLTNEHSD